MADIGGSSVPSQAIAIRTTTAIAVSSARLRRNLNRADLTDRQRLLEAWHQRKSIACRKREHATKQHHLTAGIISGQKIKGRERDIFTDTCDYLIFILVHTADIQDRDGAVDVPKPTRPHFPWLRPVFADSGYAGNKLRNATPCDGTWKIETIKRSDTAKSFEILPRRWVVERTFAWLGRCRRLAKNWETIVTSATAWALVASIRMLTRCTARYCYN